MKNLSELFEHELQDLYSAEKQITTALPKVIEAASDPSLKKSLQNHLDVTKGQIERLESIFSQLDVKSGGHKCKAMEGLVKESEDFLSEDATTAVRDAGIIAACQRIEHYEIAGYGTAHHYAKELGHSDIAELLEQTLKEEKTADDTLNDLAIERLNKRAESSGVES